MARAKVTTLTQDDAIAELVFLRGERSPKRVHAHLVEVGLITAREDGSFTVSEKTIARRIGDLTPRDPSASWSLADADADPEEARLVLDVVADAFESTTGRNWPSKAHVAEIARVRKAVPDIPPSWAYHVAQAYQLCATQERDSRYLDFALGARPWESAERADWFARLLDRPLPAESLGLHSDSLMALFRLMAYKGSLEDMQERFPDYSRDPIPEPRVPKPRLEPPHPQLSATLPPLDLSPEGIAAMFRPERRTATTTEFDTLVDTLADGQP